MHIKFKALVLIKHKFTKILQFNVKNINLKYILINIILNNSFSY